MSNQPERLSTWELEIIGARQKARAQKALLVAQGRSSASKETIMIFDQGEWKSFEIEQIKLPFEGEVTK